MSYLQCHMVVPELVLEPCSLPQDLVCTMLLDLGHVREAVLARALRRRSWWMPRPSKTAPRNGAFMSLSAATHVVEPPRSASASRDASEPIYQARAARGRTRPGGCPD